MYSPCLHCIEGKVVTGAEYVTADMAKDAGDVSLAGTLFNATYETCKCCNGDYAHCDSCESEHSKHVMPCGHYEVNLIYAGEDVICNACATQQGAF